MDKSKTEQLLKFYTNARSLIADLLPIKMKLDDKTLIKEYHRLLLKFDEKISQLEKHREK